MSNNQVVQRGTKSLPELSKKINRRCFFPSFNSTEVAVTDIQFDCQLFLRHALARTQFLDLLAKKYTRVRGLQYRPRNVNNVLLLIHTLIHTINCKNAYNHPCN